MIFPTSSEVCFVMPFYMKLRGDIFGLTVPLSFIIEDPLLFRLIGGAAEELFLHISIRRNQNENS